MLSSQALVLVTGMVVSSTVIFLAFSRQKTLFNDQIQIQIPRSCLSSGEKKKKKKKKVQFAENVKEPSGNGKEFRNQHKKKRSRVEINGCCNEIQGVPNVLFSSGIIKDQLQGSSLECSC